MRVSGRDLSIMGPDRWTVAITIEWFGQVAGEMTFGVNSKVAK